MKKFLLLAGAGYYPSMGTGDWIGMYDTLEEAKALVEKVENKEYFQQGPRKGQFKDMFITYKVKGQSVDWYEIVDLENWSGK